MRNLKLIKHSVTKSCSDLSLFEYIVLVISKILQILTVGQNSFGKKYQLLSINKLGIFLQVINSLCGDSKLQRKVSNHKLRLFYVMSILQSVSVQYDS